MIEMEYKIKLIRKVTPDDGSSFKRYAKDITISIPPFPGLVINHIVVDYVSIDVDLNLVTCYTVTIDTDGDMGLFDRYCEDHVADGWHRI